MSENHSETDDYVLIKSERRGMIRYAILYLPTKSLVIIDEDDAGYDQYIERLLKSGVRIVTSEELKKL